MDERNIYLGLFTKLLFARLIAIYSYERHIECLVQHIGPMTTAAVLLSCFRSTCVTSGISRRTHPEGEPYIYIGLEWASPPQWRIGHIWYLAVRPNELRNLWCEVQV